MAIRTTCPSCDASLSFDDAKRGKKVTCEECEETFTVPGAKSKSGEMAIQNGQKVKAKSSAKKDADEDDERPAKKKSKAEPKKSGGKGLILILGGVAAVFVLGCVGVIGLGAYYVLGTAKTVMEIPIAEHKDPFEKKVDPEPKKDGDLKKDPEPLPLPKKDPDPLPKVDPPKTGPPLTPELQKVKDATVFVSAPLSTGVRSEGSGFMTVEPGLIITNAHIIGMLDPTAPTPTLINVTLYPGEPNEKKTTAILLGVDRASDLAALRVTIPGLPSPLNLEDSTKVNATQPVQVASHPLDLKKRKPFLLTPTTVASVRRGQAGKAEAVHVGDGISRVSSGGPVVTPTGMVVGIATNDDQARRATSSDLIKRLLDGSIGDANVGKVAKVGAESRVVVSYQLIDPLKQVKESRIEVWSGPARANRPYAYMQPAPVPGDGARQSMPMAMQRNTIGTTVTLPGSTGPKQVVWLQPVIVLKDNTTQWGVATNVTPPTAAPTSPYEQRPANLVVKMLDPKDRTVKLEATFKSDTKKTPTSTKLNFNVLEQMSTGAGGVQMKTAYGSLTNCFINTEGQNQLIPKETLAVVHQSPTTYTLDNTNRIVNRNTPQLDQKLPKETKDGAHKLQYQIGTALECANLPMPNRTVKPMESWQTVASVIIRSKGKTVPASLNFTSTYEGIQSGKAIITVSGKLDSLGNPDLKNFEGPVTGTIGFDESAGYISSAKLNIASTDSNSFSLDIDLKRTTGNTANIQLAQEKQPTDPKNKTSATVFDNKLTLLPGGGFDPQFSNPKQKRIAYKQDIPLKLDKGKNYTISVTNAQFDSYLKLYGGPAIVAQAGGAGNSSKITYRAPADGVFTLSVISHNGKTGGYHLKVQETP